MSDQLHVMKKIVVEHDEDQDADDLLAAWLCGQPLPDGVTVYVEDILS